MKMKNILMMSIWEYKMEKQIGFKAIQAISHYSYGHDDMQIPIGEIGSVLRSALALGMIKIVDSDWLENKDI